MKLLELLVLEISMFSLYDFDKRVNTCSLLLSDKRVSEALRSATLCTGVFLFYIKRHLMSGEWICMFTRLIVSENRLGVNTKNALKNAGE